MVQRFSELNGINQGMAVDIGFVMFVQIMASKPKGCYLFAVLPEPDVCQITAHTHEKCTSEYIRGLKVGCTQ